MTRSHLSHINEAGEARMVDVAAKPVTQRTSLAEGCVIMSRAAFDQLKSGETPKGDVIATTRIAGIQAAKQTSNLIPLCHPLLVSGVTVDIDLNDSLPGVTIRACVKVSGQTGVEMEALSAVSVACLTLYDMMKAVDKSMEITNIRLLEKSGGRSGDWHRSPS